MTEDALSRWVNAGYSVDQARAIITWLQVERRRLRRAPRKTIGSTPEKLNVQRFAHNVAQRKLKALRKYRPRNFPKLLLAARFAPNQLLDGLCPSRQTLWTPVMSRRPLDD